MIGRRDQHIADVEKKAATGALGDLTDEVGLGDRAFVKDNISRGIFEQHGTGEGFLHLIHMLADRGQRFVRIGKRQEIVEEAFVMA